MQFGLIEMWQAMGTVARAVSILLIALSIVSLYLFVERQLVFRRAVEAHVLPLWNWWYPQ